MGCYGNIFIDIILKSGESFKDVIRLVNLFFMILIEVWCFIKNYVMMNKKIFFYSLKCESGLVCSVYCVNIVKIIKIKFVNWKW